MELDGASVHRLGKAAVVTQSNPRFLNAEDQATLDGAEICVDLALLDRASEIAVMRGAVVEHPKYSGRRVFGAGINLTHLYHGRIPFVWYLQRDLGWVNKVYRGLACRRRSAARRVRRPDRSRSPGSPRSRPSPSAATARPCW